MKLSKTEIDAVIAAAPRTFVPLDKLALSTEYQARTPEKSYAALSIAELAASIKDHGVLQNLVVIEGTRGRHEVCAGGRRLEALSRLAADGQIAGNHPIPVLVVPKDKALMSSLSENVNQVPMHPADEFLAFSNLVAQGRSVEDVAAAFGVTPLVVKRRLKLAAVSAKLMSLFRQGQIGLDCLMALASVDDHLRQEEAWSALPPWNRRPEGVRQLLARSEVEARQDAVARFVGLKAYQEAGGEVRSDLFSDDAKTVFLQDVPLLDRLAEEKLGRRVKPLLAEGWKWVEVRVRYDREEYLRHGELRRVRTTPTTEASSRIADLEASLRQLRERMDSMEPAEGDEAFEALESEAARLERERSAMEESLLLWPESLKALSGCVLFVGPDAKPATKRGLVRPEDREAVARASTSAEAGGDGRIRARVSEPSSTTRPVHSERLVRRLTAHRVAALQAELLDRPSVALAALTAQLASQCMAEETLGWASLEPVFDFSLRPTRRELRDAAEDLAVSASWRRMDREHLTWQGRLPSEPASYFSWLLAQPQAVVLALLTFVAATSLKGIYATEPKEQSNDELARALNLDMARWWTASGDSYLTHVPKKRIVEIVTQAVDAEAAAPLAALRKADAVAAAERLLGDRPWLPEVLRLRRPDSDEGGTAAQVLPESEVDASSQER